MSLRLKRTLTGSGSITLTSRTGGGLLRGVSITGSPAGDIPIEEPRDPIVYENLLVNLDAGNSDSYPGTGTTWFDLENNYDATLTNGPTYSSANSGSIVLDDVNDYLAFSTPIPVALNSSFSFCSFMRVSSFTDTNPGLWRLGTGATDWFVFQTTNGRPWVRWNSVDILNPTSGWGIPVGSWVHIALVIQNASRVTFYANGVAQYDRVHSTATSAKNISIWGYQYDTNFKLPGNYAVLQMYNKALTSTEVNINFDAHKSRYGL
jgi:hypothetical protein